MAHLMPPFGTLRPPDNLPHHRGQTHEWGRGQHPCQGLGSGATSCQGRRVPWAHNPLLGDGAGADLCDLTPDYTVQNLTRMGLAASVLLLLGVLLCQAWKDHRGARDAAWS